jgi:PKHD-type hydroxylase
MNIGGKIEMNNVPRFWMWDKFLTPENCDALIAEYYKPEEEKAAEVGGTGKNILNLNHRKTDVCWIPTSEAISLLLFSKSLVANYKTGWGFDIEDCEPTQIAKYEEGGHYDWHTDEIFFVKTAGYHRKVSSVLLLSDPSTYTGGELLLDLEGNGGNLELNRGTILCFPSELRHKVMPVTEGVRYSLASWAVGPLMR